MSLRISKHYFEKFNELMKILESNEQVKVIEKTPVMTEKESAAPRAFNKLTNEKKYHIPNEYISILEIPETLKLFFSYNINNKYKGGGEFQIYALYSSLTSEKDYKLYSKPMHNENDIEILKYLRIIDDHPFSGNFQLAAFYKKPGVSPPNIPDIYFYDRGKYYKMTIDYFGYLDAVLDLAGITYWQYLFCNINLKSREYSDIYDKLKSRLEALSILFPEKDFTKYEQLLIK